MTWKTRQRDSQAIKIILWLVNLDVIRFKWVIVYKIQHMLLCNNEVSKKREKERDSRYQRSCQSWLLTFVSLLTFGLNIFIWQDICQLCENDPWTYVGALFCSVFLFYRLTRSFFKIPTTSWPRGGWQTAALRVGALRKWNVSHWIDELNTLIRVFSFRVWFVRSYQKV